MTSHGLCRPVPAHPPEDPRGLIREDQAATIADAVLAEGYRRVVGDDTTVRAVARTPGPGAGLIRRVEELDHEAAELGDNVVTALGDTEKAERVCGEMRVALQQLATLLEDARPAEQP